MLGSKMPEVVRLTVCVAQRLKVRAQLESLADRPRPSTAERVEQVLARAEDRRSLTCAEHRSLVCTESGGSDAVSV